MSRSKTAKRGKGRVYTNLDASTKRHAAEETAVAVKRGEMTSEVASYSNDFLALPLQNGVVPNPDEIMMNIAPGKLGQYQKLGTDPYQLHRIMRRTDLKYKHLVQTRKNGVLSKEWSILPNPHDPDQDRAWQIAEFLKAAFDDLDNFHADLDEMLDAIFLGYQVSEIMWEQKTIRYGEGQARLAWVVGDLRGRRQGRFGFAEDGSLMYQESAGKFIPVAPVKFVKHTHGRVNEGQYGTAECTEVFWAWFMKHYFGKWWAIFGEKFGMPTAVAKHPANWDDDKKRKLKNVLKAFQTEYGIVIPENASIEFLEAQRYGTVNVYQSFMDWADRCMSEAITGQSLATGQGEGGSGSYAQSQTHAEVKQEYIAADAKELMATVQSQLIRPMVELNFGEDVPLPQFVIDYEARNLAADLELDGKLVNEIGLPLPEQYFYEKYGRPTPGEGDVVVVGRKSGSGFGLLPGDNALPVDDAVVTKPKAKPAKEADDEEELIDDDTGAKKKNARSQRARTFSVTPEADDEALRRRGEADNLLGSLAAEGREIFGNLGDLILSEAEAATDLADLRERVQALHASGAGRTDLARALVKAKVNGYLFAAAQVTRHANEVLLEDEALEGADEETRAAGFLRTIGGRQQFAMFDSLSDYEPLDPEQALKFFEDLVPLTKPEAENLPREAAGSSFTVADIETRSVLDKVKGLIGKFLGNGGTKKDFVEEYQATRKENGLDPAENHRAEALFRTETMRAYGAGRTRSLNDPEVKGAFPMWQYVAIMDDRTRDEHRALNGYSAPPDDPIWLSKTPPWDHNCRCDIIPLSRRQIETRGVEFSPTVTMPDGSEVDPRTWPTSPGFRGIGF